MTGLLKKQNIVIAILLAVVVFVSSFLYCDASQAWGDDFAAYILEGRAIANGTTAQQHRDNVFLHPSEVYFDDITEMSELVYVWGYPLVLSVVYKLVGFDIDMPQNILYYKIPGCIALAALAAVLFLFFRRRLRPGISLALTLSILYMLLYEQNFIGTDLPFLCFSFLCFWLYELLREPGTNRKKILLGILLGFSMWYTYALRLNGFTVIALLALQTAFCLWKRRPGRSELLLQLHPFVLCLVLFVICKIIAPSPTSNIGDVGLGSFSQGLRYCRDVIHQCLFDLIPFGPYRFRLLASYGIELCLYIGLISQSWRKEPWYTLFFAATILVNASLPYAQGLRYFYNVLPFVLLYVVYGIDTLHSLVCRTLSRESHRRVFSRWFAILAAGFVIIELAAQSFALPSHRIENANTMSQANASAYAADCMEAYHFIMDETEESDIIAFIKPRALYLNTNRMSFRPFMNGHSLEDADYYMRIKNPLVWAAKEDLTEAQWAQLESVFSNEGIEIYRVLKQ